MKLMKLVTAAFVAAALAIVPNAWADTDTTNDNDALTITITPDFDIGVNITTGATVVLGYTVTPGATQYSSNAASATVVGDLSPQEWDVNGFALDNWTLDADETPTADAVQMYLLFAVGRTSSPTESEFDGTDRIVSGTKRAGGSGGLGTTFEDVTVMQGQTDLDNMNVSDEKQMWFRMDTPSNNSQSTDQKFQITLTAVSSGL